VADVREAEVAVVGSGPGGAVTACALAEAGRDVLVVEEGAEWTQASAPPFSRREMEQKYRHGGPVATLGRARIAYAEGCCVGGGSEVNSGLHHRTPPEVLDAWRRTYAIDAFDEAALRPHFEAIERDLGIGVRPGPPPAAALALRDGARHLGWTSIDVPRAVAWEPASTGADGRRRSMTETYLPRLRAAGGRLLADTRVLRLERRAGRWLLHAVHAPAGTPPRPLAVMARSVVVAGGAVQTPALLRRSGIRANVGDALRLHPMLRVAARFPAVVNPPGAGVAAEQVKALALRVSLGCSVSTPPYLAVALADHVPDLRLVDREGPRMAIYYAMTGGGRGTVRALPPWRDPLVRYRLDAADLADAADALVALCRVLLAAGATELYPAVAGLGPLASERDLGRIPRPLPPGRAGVVALHLFASCPMGEDRRVAAVDSFGRVHGVDGLRVADASLLGGPPGVNPQGTIMAIVRRNALAGPRPA
jgi:choline dehydrogenase-like flavoprotein